MPKVNKKGTKQSCSGLSADTFEIFDLILSKVVLLQMYFGDRAKRPADRCIFMNLASVNGLWSEVIKRRRFKMTVVQLLAVYFRKVKIWFLPFEIFDVILSKVVLLQMCFGDKTKRPADRCIFMNLASVNGLWSELIQRKHFKMTVVQLLAVYYRKAKKRSIIIDHNYEFLMDVLQPDSLIDQLELTGCLNQNQISSLKRIRKVKDKNNELLLLLRNFNSQNYSQFVQCLCATDQNNAARLLEYGGETVKVHIGNRDTFQTAELESSLAKELLQEEKGYCNELIRTGLPHEQRLEGVSVLHAKQDYGITIWLWFKTKDAWNKMKFKSQYILLEIMQKLFQRLMSKSAIEPQDVQLQYFNSKNEFVKRKLLIQAKKGFQIKGDAEHVVVLKDKIYVAQRRRILVYKNEVPYPRLKEIRLPEDIPEIESPLQIAVCLMHNCLYAADRDKQCIYKIEPMYDHRVTLWLKEPGSFLVATTCSGEVLVLRRERGADSLRVFNNDGVLMHDISVRNDFYHELEIAQEIAPNVIALIYSNRRGQQPFSTSAIFARRLNRLELIDRKHSRGLSIYWLVPFSSCQSLIGVRRDYDDEKRFRIALCDYHFWSIQTQNILYEKPNLVDIYFSADQKELFVMTADKPICFPDVPKPFFDLFKLIDDMSKQSMWFPNAEEHEWFRDRRRPPTEMKRRVADMEKNNLEIEIYKMNYEDEDYD